MTDVLERLRQHKVVPVIVIDDALHAVPLAAALDSGGLACAEVTFRTPAAAESLRRINDQYPDFTLGAGTVTTIQQASTARESGAKFVVSPGLNPAVVEYCMTHDIPVYPGVCTPTEIEAALVMGLRTLKFFPAQAMGGASFLKAVSAPYVGIEFMPTGGIDRSIIGEYLSLTNVIACGGSWMAPHEWIGTGQFDRIRNEAAVTVELVRRNGIEA